MVTVRQEGKTLVFERDGVEFYDRQIPSEAEFDLFMRDMSEKNWFADVRQEVTFLISVDWGKS